MIAEKTPTQVLLSFLDYRAFYREPVFEAWDRTGALMLGLFHAFRQWNVGLENISAKRDPANAKEVQMTVDLFERRASFNFGIGGASLFVTNPVWLEADLITQVIRAGMQAARTSAKAEIHKQQLALAMHLRPQGRSLREITSDFVRLGTESVMGEEIRSGGFSVYTANRSLVVDLSTLYNDSLFVRLTRTFAPEASFEDLAPALDKDEKNVLELLGLRLD